MTTPSTPSASSAPEPVDGLAAAGVPDQEASAGRRDDRRRAMRRPGPVATSGRALRQRVAARTLGRATRPLVVGAEHVPAGAVAVVVNHPGRLDQQLLEAALTDAGEAPRVLWFTTLDDQTEVDEARDLLASGETVVIFVEGDRSPDGSVHRPRAVVGDLVTGLDVPVVPAAIRLPVDRRGWLAAAGAAGPAVEFAAPLDLARHREHPEDPVARQAALDAVAHAITVLAGQPYVDLEPAEHRAALRRQAVDERAARAEAARAERANAERARAEAEQAAREDAERQVRELAEAEEAARAHAARAAAEDAARRAALRTQRGPASGAATTDPSGAPTSEPPRTASGTR